MNRYDIIELYKKPRARTDSLLRFLVPSAVSKQRSHYTIDICLLQMHGPIPFPQFLRESLR